MKNGVKILLIVGICIVVLSIGAVGFFSVIYFLGTYSSSNTTTTSNNLDIIKEHGDYFKYSLGDYDYDEWEEDYEYTDQLFTGKTYTRTITNRVFTFKDSKGNERELTINDNDSNIRNNFNKVISDLVYSYLEEQIAIEMDKKDLSELKDIVKIGENIVPNIETIDKSIQITDTTKGVKFTDLNLNTLKENNLIVNYTLQIYMRDLNQEDKLKSLLEKNYGSLLEKENNPNAKFEFSLYNDNEYPPTYTKKLTLQYDGNKFIWS